MPTVQQLVKLRPEVEQGNLHGIVSLYALLDAESPDVFERDPARVLDATYPSVALGRLLHRLQISLNEKDTDRKGNFVISGGYGSGKSHVLLTLYHLLAHPEVARPWLAEHKFDFVPPDDAIVVLMPMTNLTQLDSYAPVDYLWEPIFAKLGYTGFHHTGNNFPTVGDLRQAVGGRQVFLIIDEIERWFMPIKDKHQAEANITFLQNLTEFAKNPDNGMFVLLTLLMLEPRICNIVGRDDAFFEDLTGAPDRRSVVLHRLVAAVNLETAASVVEAYLDQYRPVESYARIGDYSQYRETMLACYPFHPATIASVFERYSSVARKEETSYQNSRGALYLLAHLLQETLPPSGERTGKLQDRDMLLPGDVSLSIERVVTDLNNLDPHLVDVAYQNVARSEQEGVAHAEAILSTVLLHSLGDPKSEKYLGATLSDVLLGTLRPQTSARAVTASGVQSTLQNLEGTALNLHFEPTPPRWLFRTEVNIVAQINRRARRADIKDKAKQHVVDALKAQVGGSVFVYPFDDVPDRRELTLVLTTERMESEAILDKLYYGRAYPNALVIVDPRHMGSLIEDVDVLWIAQRILAAESLKYDLVGDAEAQKRIQDFLEGMGGQRQNLRDQLRDRYGMWRAPIYDDQTGALTFTRVPVTLDRGAILREVGMRYDVARFRQNVKEAVLARTTPPTVADVRAEFLRQRAYAKPVWQGHPSDEPIDQAIRDLVNHAELEVVKGGGEHYVCGEDPGTLLPGWTVAVPPEVHKPRFDLYAVIQETFATTSSGLTVQEVRDRCYEAAVRFPGTSVDRERVDAQISDMVARHELESSSPAAPIFGPIPDTVVLRKPGHKPSITKPTSEDMNFGPASIAQLRTDIVRRINKTDVLSQVRVTYHCTLNGADLQSASVLVDLGPAGPGDARLALNWNLERVSITDRDGLLRLLDKLAYPNLAEVAISLRRDLPPSNGSAA